MIDGQVHRYSPFTVDAPDGIGLVPACTCGWRADRELIELGGYEKAIDRFDEHVLAAYGLPEPARMI
jgi:hypothetical protein